MPRVQARAPELPSRAPSLVTPRCDEKSGELDGGGGAHWKSRGEATVEPRVVVAACRRACGRRTCSHAND